MKNWNTIPEEMRNLNQWVLAGNKKEPLLLSENGSTYNASPIKGPWLSFEDAIVKAHQCGYGIGFILTASDPFTCIDLDVKDLGATNSKGELLPPEELTTQTVLNTYSGYIDYVDSYTELSTSGKGIHIWCKAILPAGRRQGGVEVYSDERFIVCTGNSVVSVEYYKILNKVFLNTKAGSKPIVESQRQVDQIVSTFKGHAGTLVPLIEVAQTLSDDEVWDRATNSANGEKFLQLVTGDWDSMVNSYGDKAYKSHSQADAAMFEFLCFHSVSNSQCIRLFFKTGLAQRDKAQRKDYIHRTIRVSRTRMAEEALFAETSRLQGEILAQQLIAKHKKIQLAQNKSEAEQALYVPEVVKVAMNPDLIAFNGYMKRKHSQTTPTILNAVSELQGAPATQTVHSQGDYPYEGVKTDSFHRPSELDWPPGVVGRLAKFIYRSAHKPVREMAITASLGLMAGLCAQTYKYNGKGLNMYLLLIADSGTGKDIVHTGIESVLSQCADVMRKHVDNSSYASAPALNKAFTAEHSCFVNLIPELGSVIREMAEGRNPQQKAIGAYWTQIFEQTGVHSRKNNLTYSDKDKNSGYEGAFAYSILGETTPQNFYDSITDDMLSDGFMSRMTMIEYKGKTVPSNHTKTYKMQPDLISDLDALAVTVYTRMNENQFCMVQQTPQVTEQYLKLDAHSALKMNTTDSQAIKSIHNRETAKIMRVAGLLAVADNPNVPEVNMTHFNWALQLLNLQTKTMIEKIKTGGIGRDDQSCETCILQYCRDYITGEKVPTPSHKIDPAMIKEGIISKRWLCKAVSQVNCFRKHNFGSSRAISDTIKNLIEKGYLVEIDKKELKDRFARPGACYRLIVDGE